VTVAVALSSLFGGSMTLMAVTAAMLVSAPGLPGGHDGDRRGGP